MRLTEAALRPTYATAPVARPPWPDWSADQHVRLCEWESSPYRGYQGRHIYHPLLVVDADMASPSPSCSGRKLFMPTINDGVSEGMGSRRPNTVL